MAVAFDGFSIREYAANMRNIDSDVGWPFGDDAKSRSLPDMAVRKFRFWSEEVKIAGSIQETENMLLLSSSSASRGKQRTPKKRSIVELFAVAPPVVESVEQTDHQEKEEAKIQKKKKKKKKKKNKNKLKVEICASSKKDAMHKTWSGKNNGNLADSRSRRKPTFLKNLPKKHSFKLQCSRLISKKRKGTGKVLPVHSILRNPSKATSKMAGAKSDMQGGNLINFCCESAKHVTFSGKDDIIEHVRSCSSMDIPQLQNLCKIFSDVLAAKSALDNRHQGDKLPSNTDVVQVEKVTDMNVSTSILETRDETLCEKQQSNDSHAELIIPETNIEMSSFSISEDQNHVTKSYIDPTPQRIPCSVNSEQLSSQTDVHVKETSLRISDSDSRSVTTPLRKRASSSGTSGSLSFIGNSNSNPPYIQYEIGRQSQPRAVPVNDTYLHIAEFHPMHRQLPSKDQMQNMQIRTERCLGEDFVGLPLNSQGELIQLQSGARFGLSEISKRQNTLHGSIFNYPVHNYSEPSTSVNHVKLLKGKYPGSMLDQQYSNASNPLMSRINFSNMQSLERFEVQRNNKTCDRDQIFHHGSNLRQVSCFGCREDNRTRNYIDRVNFGTEGNLNHVSQPSIQQTMRLMGKDVTVCQNDQSFHGFNDRRIWTDKEVVTNNCHTSRVSDLPLRQQWSPQQWVSNAPTGSSRENLFQPLEASSNFYHMPSVASRLGLTHFDCRPQWISRNDISSNNRNLLKVDFMNHPYLSQSLFNDASRTAQIPLVVSNSTHCKHSQGIAYSRTSTFSPPFLCNESGSSIQPSPTTHSSPNLPQWLLNAKQQKESQGSCSSYSNPIACHQQHNMSHTDLFPLPSSLPTSTISFPVSTSNTFQQGVQSLTFPAYSTSKSIPAVNNPCRSKNKNREGTNFNFTYLKCVDVSSKTRKRPAAKDDGFMKPAKKAYLQIQEDPRQRDQIERYDLNINNNNINTVGESISDVNCEKEVFSNVSAPSSSQVLSQTKHGPVKLSAGAKHILKPSEDTDQANCRTIHSTIPFSVGNTSGKFLDTRRKAAEIYRF